MEKGYTQHKGKAAEDSRFSHMMAISLDPATQYKRGLIRCITSREGDVQVKGYTDRSKLFKVSGESLEHFVVEDELTIQNADSIIESLGVEGLDYLGLEDPDIWRDEITGLMHLYFTMPFVHRKDTAERYFIHLGHAVGKDLGSLEMTMPVLQADGTYTAKEVSIAPQNAQGARLNLFESSDSSEGMWYSTVQVAVAEDMGKPWKPGATVFHPAKANISWIGGHASPGPLFSKNFMDVGKGKLLGVINGREANTHKGGKTLYGMFSVGLFIYDYEHGKIEWVSPEPFIQDSEAKTITFASQFVETEQGEGVLYAHVDDSFVRAYTLNAQAIRALLPK